MKTLFFAGNKKHKKFFQSIIDTIQIDGKIIYSKSIIFPCLLALKDITKVDLSAPINLKTNDFIAKNGLKSLHPIIKLNFKLLAYYNYLRYYGVINDKYDQIMVWNGTLFRQAIAIEIAKLKGIKTLYAEIGLLPNRVTIDPKGVNFTNSVPRDKSFFENFQCDLPLPTNLIPRAAKNAKKFANVEKIDLPKEYIFIPFQVDYDTQILVNSPWIKDMNMLFETIEQIAHKLPHLNFVFKEHPSSIKDYPNLHTKTKEIPNIYFANGHITQELIQNASAVITINSTVGIESLLFQKKVIVLGNAFFTIEGITKFTQEINQLENILSNIDKWELNTSLVENFLKYLYYDYLVDLEDNQKLSEFFK